MSAMQDVRTSGAVLSTNAQIKVNCGFQPAFVKLFTVGQNTEAFWMASMPQDAIVRRSGDAVSNATYTTTSGIKLFKDSSGEGFTIEPGAPVNPAGSSEIFWLALRGWGPTL